nr:putative vacuolar amino acid transporter ypq3 [Quercus suber]
MSVASQLLGLKFGKVDSGRVPIDGPKIISSCSCPTTSAHLLLFVPELIALSVRSQDLLFPKSAKMLGHGVSLTWNEALSGIFGSISLAAWIFLLVPQLIENYTQGSADGISLTFLVIWFVGDVTNLVGAIWAGLVPTVIALAIYFCFADTILISQVVYYKYLVAKKQEKNDAVGSNGHSVAPGEDTPLLNGNDAPQAPVKKRHSLNDVDESNIGLPGSRRRSSANHTQSSSMRRDSTLDRILEEPTKTTAWTKNTISVFLVIAAGAAGWALAWKAGAWRPSPIGQEEDDKGMPVGAEVLGYASAVCYLGARIPQIVKNQRERSCDGLSLLFFLLSLLGNATYGAGILFHSVEKQYFLTNLPWLIGSLGTMVEDAIIFIQFSVFGEKASSAEEGKITKVTTIWNRAADGQRLLLSLTTWDCAHKHLLVLRVTKLEEPKTRQDADYHSSSSGECAECLAHAATGDWRFNEFQRLQKLFDQDTAHNPSSWTDRTDS